MPNGTSYVGLDISTQYYSYVNVNDRIKNGENLKGMEVKCKWQGFDRTYEIAEISDKNINEVVNGCNTYEYYQREQPYRLENINPNSTKTVVVINHKENDRKENYIPQSLYLVFRRETIAAYDSKFSKTTDKLTKLPMDKRLEIMQDFVNDLNSKANGIIIPEPIIAGELGYSVYNAVLNAPKLLIDNNRKIAINEKYKAFSNCFYRMPNNEIVIGFMYFDKKKNDCCKAIQTIIDYLLKGLVNGQRNEYLNAPLIPIKYSTKHYIYRTDSDNLSLKMQAEEISKSKIVNFVVCIVPMESDDNEYSTDRKYYDIFKKVFADIDMPSQMVSLKMLNNNSINSYLQNIALGILGKAGSVPWILEKPFSDVDCFVGIDVGMQSKGIHYPATSVCFDSNGNLLGYYKTEKAQSGEKIDTKILEDMFDKIFIEYKDKNGHLSNHIVIHRDGFSNEADEWYEEYFSSKSIEYDLVEVKKDIPERLIDKSNLNGMNPDAGICVIKDNEAIIVTTQRKANFGGAPQPIKIVHKHGSLTMNEIVRQIYALSELHVGSIKSTRLPMTTYYADRICKAGDYIPRGNVYNKLYFL